MQQYVSDVPADNTDLWYMIEKLSAYLGKAGGASACPTARP